MNVTIGVLYAIIAMVTFGLSEILAKLATDKIGGKKALLFGQLFELIIISIYVLLFIEIPPLTFESIAICILCAIFSAIGYITFFRAMELGDISIISPIAANWVLITVILSLVFFKETLTILQLVSLILLLVGIFLISVVWKDLKKSIKKRLTRGVKESLITMICWGIGFFLLKFVVDSLGAIFPIIIFRIISLLIVYMVVAKSKIKINLGPKLIILFLFLSALFDIVGIATYGIGITTEYVSIISPIAAASPLITIILAYIFLKERMAFNQKIGALFILSGLILISIV